VRLWEGTNGTFSSAQATVLQGYKSRINGLAFSPDGKTLAAGTQDSSIILWSMSTKEEVAAFAAHRGSISCVAFAPHGNILATGSNDRTVKLWYAAKRLDPEYSGDASAGWTKP
jgi:WD40 repeat protein